MSATRCRSGALFFVLLVGSALPLTPAASQPGEVPGPIGEAWAELRVSFDGSRGLDPSFMESAIERNSTAIDAILAYAKASPRNADALADYLLGLLAEYAIRFKPGRELDDRVIRDANRAFPRGEEPDNGLNIGTYLLLEIASQKKSPSFTRKALSAVHDVVQAHSYVRQQGALLRMPGIHDDMAIGRKAAGGFLTTLGGEMAWCCERFMVDVYRSDDPHLPDVALAVIQDYWQWRKESMAKWHRTDCLNEWEQHRTMAIVEKLTEVLPAAGSTTPGTEATVDP